MQAYQIVLSPDVGDCCGSGRMEEEKKSRRKVLKLRVWGSKKSSFGFVGGACRLDLSRADASFSRGLGRIQTAWRLLDATASVAENWANKSLVSQ